MEKDYKKMYEDALKRAMNLALTNNISALAAGEIFPELCDSEDEKIRKDIVEYIKSQGASKRWDFNTWIAWLEKQKAVDVLDEEEREFADNVDSYRKEVDAAYQKGYNEGVKATLEKQGDISPTEDELEALRIAAYEPIKNWSEKLQSLYEKLVYCEYKPADKVEPKFKVGDWIVDKHYLKTYQVFSIDISEHNYIVYSCKPLFNTNSDWPCFHEDMIRLWTIQDAKDDDVLEFGDHVRLVVGIASYVNKTTGKVDVYCLLENNNFKMGIYYNLDTIKPHPATKEQRDLLFQKMKEAGYEWDAEKKELKKIEQNPAWSEEDEYQINTILHGLDLKRELYKKEGNQVEENRYKTQYDWLKSLKDRVQPHHKQEWSERDKHILKNIHDFVKENTIDSNRVNCAEECLNWLKSLKPQTHWKPSDEQMKAIKYFIDFHRSQANASTEGWSEFKHLESLYNILKKL